MDTCQRIIVSHERSILHIKPNEFVCEIISELLLLHISKLSMQSNKYSPSFHGYFRMQSKHLPFVASDGFVEIFNIHKKENIFCKQCHFESVTKRVAFERDHYIFD